MKRVEGPEEFLLRLLLSRDELNVVDHQNVELAVARAEFLRRVVAYRADQVVRELFGAYVEYFSFRVCVFDMVADRVHQVRLSESDLSPYKERVVCVSGRFGDGQARGVRKAVRLADDEGRKDVVRVEAVLARRPLGRLLRLMLRLRDPARNFFFLAFVVLRHRESQLRGEACFGYELLHSVHVPVSYLLHRERRRDVHEQHAVCKRHRHTSLKVHFDRFVFFAYLFEAIFIKFVPH